MEGVGDFLRDAGVVFANGWLALGYFLADHGALLVSLVSLGILLRAEGRALEQLLGRPLRVGGRAAVPLSHRRQQVITLAVGLAWAVTCLRTPSPVPQIGAVMWAVSALYVLRAREPGEVVWRLKGFLALYALVPPAFELLLRLNLFYSSPYEWARYLDLPVEAAAESTAQFNAILLQVALTIMRYGVPFSFAWYVLQRAGVHVPGWFAPGRDREEAARRMRYRE